MTEIINLLGTSYDTSTFDSVVGIILSCICIRQWLQR